MQYTQLGKTDLLVSRICFGCWQLSPAWWGEVPLDPWQRAVQTAVDLGVNFLDTANAYGEGYAEQCLGDLFTATPGLRDKYVVATKFYWNFTVAPRHPDTRYQHILDACDASLTRLQTDRIDLYQIHAWDALTRPDEVAAAFMELKRAGKVRWFGVSNLNVEQMALYGDHFEVASLQPIYNLMERDIEARELPYCLSKRIGVIPYSPLQRGLLTGKYAPDQTFDDSRGNSPHFKQPAFGILMEALQALKPIAEAHDLTIPQLAIRWILTHPAITAPIVGVKEPRHIETIVKAADGVLDQATWHGLANTVKAAKAKALAAL